MTADLVRCRQRTIDLDFGAPGANNRELASSWLQIVGTNERTMNSPATLEAIEEILREDPNMSEHDIYDAPQDYCERYWQQVESVVGENR